MNNKYFIIISLFFTAFTLAASENLIHNSSFELGAASFGIVRHMDYIKTDLKYIPASRDFKSYIHGKSSLFVPCKTNESVHIKTNEAPIKPDTPYTFSFYLKSSNTCKVTVSMNTMTHGSEISPVNSWWAKKVEITITNEFKRYSITVPKIPSEYNRVHCELKWEGADVWCDAFQLETGNSASAYKPANNIEYTLDNNKTRFLPGKIIIKLQSVNYTDAETSENLLFLLKDLLRNKPKHSIKVSITVPPKENTDKDILLNLTENSVYSISGAGPIPLQFGIYPPIDRKKQPQGGFQIGLSGGFASTGRIAPHFIARNCGIGEWLEYLRDQGINILRLHDDANYWYYNQPEMERFDWEYLDKMVSFAEQFNLDVMPVFGSGAFISKSQALKYPSLFNNWFIYPKSSIANNLTKRDFSMPPPEAWRKYISELVTRYSNRIHYWEIINEPNLYLSADQYFTYAKLAYETAKKIDKNCQVVGITTTGDFNSKLKEFIDNCGRIGAINYCDIVAFHPYNSPLDNSPYTAMQQIEDIRNILNKYGANKPLANTELYFINSIYSGIQFNADIFPPENLMIRYLIDLGEGLKFTAPLHSRSVIAQDLHPNCDAISYSLRRLTPNGNVLVNNTFSRIFSGAFPDTKLQLPLGINGYRYRLANNKYVVALWSGNSTNNFDYTVFDVMESVIITDFLGNKLSKGNHILDRHPIFIFGDTKQNLDKALSLCAFQPKEPVKINGVQASVYMGKPATAIEITNTSGKAHDFWCRISDDKSIVKVKIKPFETINVYLPSYKPGNIKLIYTVDNKQYLANYKIPDIKFANNGETIQGAENFTFSINKKEDLTFLIKVKDYTPLSAHQKEPWKGDCIELFVDINPDKNLHNLTYNGNKIYRLFLQPSTTDGKGAKITATKVHPVETIRCNWNFKKTNDGYQFEINIPWDAFKCEKEPDNISFDISVDDGDGITRKQSYWSGDKNNYYQRRLFGRITKNQD